MVYEIIPISLDRISSPIYPQRPGDFHCSPDCQGVKIGTRQNPTRSEWVAGFLGNIVFSGSFDELPTQTSCVVIHGKSLKIYHDWMSQEVSKWLVNGL